MQFTNIVHQISAVTLTVISASLIMCQHFTNPFENFDNADMHIVDQTTFATQWTDTLDIFSNDTLYLAATVPELIDSYTVSVSNNRAFQKKTVIKPKAAVTPFRISVFETGDQVITIEAFRKNGTSGKKHILFYSKNPLFQKDLLGCDLNDSLVLSTYPVADNNVIYTWILDHHVVRSPYAHERTRMFQMDNRVRTGRLYISDSLRFKSPDVKFQFSFIDNIPPEITCVEDGFDKRTKTIRTADSIFVVSVHVDDGIEQPVQSVRFNGTLVESTSKNIYKKVITNAHSYTQEHPYSMIITATDNFNNIASDTLHIVFDPSYIKKDSTFITIYKSSGDTLWTAANPITLTGTVSNSDSKPVNLKATLNDSPLFDAPFPSGSGIWSQTCALQPAYNILTIKAFSEKSVLLTERSILIMHNDQITDTTPPVLLPPLVNNTESERFYVTSTTAQLSFQAYDYESGIKSVIINKNDTLSVAAGQYLWRKTISDINHDWETIILEISDRRNNKTSDSIRICFNRVPTAMPSKLPYAIEVNKEYTEQIMLFDPDIDTLVIVPVKWPADLIFSDDNKQFSWLPRMEHIGADTLIFQIYDRFQTSEKYIWPFKVYDPSSVNLSISLADNQNIPTFLRALQDTLKITAALGVPSGTPPYTYRIQILKNSGLLDSSSDDGKLSWTPEMKDTGVCQIRLYIEDGLKHSDTVISQVQIVRPNADTAQLFLKDVSGTVLLDSNSLFVTVPDPPSLLTFEIIDTDHPLTEKYAVSVVMNGFTTEFTPAEKLFQFSINPPSFINDSMFITLKDNTRLHPCSLTYIIINPVSDPTFISGLQRWFKPENLSSTFFSTTWKEFFSSDNNLTASEGVSSNKNGLNDNPTVKISASYLTSIDGGNWLTTPFSIFMLAKYDSLPGSSQPLISNFSQNSAISFSLGLSSTGQVMAFTSNFMSNTPVKTSLYTEKNSWYIYSFCSNGIDANKSITVQMGLNRTFETVKVSNVPDELDMSIGSNNRNTNRLSGEIADILQYNRVLNSAECRRVIGYLMKKYGLH